MRIYQRKSLLTQEKQNVYVLKSLEDWRELEDLLKKENEDFLKYNPHFYSIRDEFKRYIGKIWQDKEHLRYSYNGEPVYTEYKIIAVEDDNAMRDWYWALQNVNDPNEVKYILCNDVGFESGLKDISSGIDYQRVNHGLSFAWADNNI